MTGCKEGVDHQKRWRDRAERYDRDGYIAYNYESSSRLEHCVHLRLISYHFPKPRVRMMPPCVHGEHRWMQSSWLLIVVTRLLANEAE